MRVVDYSIIVPVYNAEDTLSRCVESIICQTEKNFELILVDDGSTDNSGFVCDKYRESDERIRVFHLPNGGVSNARNKGVDIASGKYIVFIDSDDYVDNTYLEKFNVTDDDFVICGYRIEGYNVDNEIEVKYKEEELVNNGETITYLFESNFIATVWGKRYKREIINDLIRFDGELEYGEDTLFNIAYIQKCSKVRIIRNVMYHYVRYANDTLGILKNDIESVIKAEKLTRKLREYLRKIPDLNVDEMIARRNGPIFYNILLKILNAKKIDYKLLKFLFKQTEFRKTIDYIDIVYSKESMKFKLLLKTKSVFVIWLYMNFLHKSRNMRVGRYE